MFKRIVELIRKKSLERLTFIELSKLTDKELKDIGLSRSMLRHIARNHAEKEVSNA